MADYSTNTSNTGIWLGIAAVAVVLVLVIAMLAGTAASVLAILWFHRPGEQVTREPLVAHEFDPDEDTLPSGD